MLTKTEHDEAGGFTGSVQYYIKENGERVLHGAKYYRTKEGFLARDDYEHGKLIKSWYVGLSETPAPEAEATAEPWTSDLGKTPPSTRSPR